MRVLLAVHQYLPDHFAGTEQLTRKVARALVDNGEEVMIVTADPARARESSPGFVEDAVDDIPVIRLSGGRHGSDWFAMDTVNPNIKELLAFIMASFRPDIVHVHHFGLLGMGLCEAVKKSGAPLLFTATDFWLLCPLGQLEWPRGTVCAGPTSQAGNCLQHIGTQMLEARLPWAGKTARAAPQAAFELSARMSRVFPVGPLAPVASLSHRRNAIKERLQQIDIAFAPTEPVALQMMAAGLSRARIVDLPYGVEPPVRDQDVISARAGSAIVIGFIGSLAPHKGAHLLLEAIGLVGRDDAVEVRIYGDETVNPPYVLSLRALAAEAVHPVSFQGTFLEEEFGRVLSEVDVLVLPSTWRENRPLTLLAALLARVPVIVSDMPGMTCEVVQEDNGLIFPAGNVTALAAILRRVVREPELRYKLAASERRPARLDGYVAVLRQYYRRLLETHRPQLMSHTPP